MQQDATNELEQILFAKKKAIWKMLHKCCTN
jgi:hypothetical protein